jgi:hypothetical protein
MTTMLSRPGKRVPWMLCCGLTVLPESGTVEQPGGDETAARRVRYQVWDRRGRLPGRPRHPADREGCLADLPIGRHHQPS